MFKWKVRVYKNIDWKEESVSKEFDNENDFNEFIDKNPELKSLNKWEDIKWPESLFNISWFFDEAKRLWNTNFFKEIEKDLDSLIEKSRKLLWK